MIGKILLFTIGVGLYSYLQLRHWLSKGYKRESWTFLFWMGLSWLVGLLFLLGIRLPTPDQPLFPNWK